ncbi:methyl-accepting chemotaxis protein [Derxia gummosa]|uniref:Methyl-accepting chemotaxis protein n=1 Tax=Derxia gummosa DSM 723 TaxID=1121388 RepID=A0A8B6X560_9BURK|nr:methyl-accepting chemotaxis protein [Derxia gummosa]
MLVARISLRAKLLLAPLVAIAALGSVSLAALHVLDHETAHAADAVERNLSALRLGASVAPALADSQTAARRVALGLAADQPAADLAKSREAARAGLARATEALSALADEADLPAASADVVRGFGFDLRPYRATLDDLLDNRLAPDAATLATLMASTERQADRLQRRAVELTDSLAAVGHDDTLAVLTASRGWLRGLLVALGMALLPSLAIAFVVERRALADIRLLAQLVERLRLSGSPVEQASATAMANAMASACAMAAGNAAHGAVPPPQPADFTGAVEALAFRGNLLALNAAVEAARHAGPGNAIASVAEDARRLAQAATLMADECRWQQRLADLDAAARAACMADDAPAASAPGPVAGVMPARAGACFTPPQVHLRHDLGRED